MEAQGIQVDDVTLFMAVEEITPEIALDLLIANTHNRPVTKRAVDFIADQMRSGDWKMAGDPIRISSTGVLLDGQHRLNAIVESMTTQKLLVIRGLSDDTFDVMDTGRMRMAADVLAVRGHANSRLLASVVRMIVSYKRGNFANTLANAGRVSGLTVTNGEIDKFAAENDLQSFVLQAKIWYKTWPLFTGSEYGFFYFTLSEVDPAAAFEFLGALSLGADLPADSSIFLLRKKMEQYRLGVKKISITPTEKLGLVFKAWNLYRKDKTVSYLTFNKEKEEVPTPI